MAVWPSWCLHMSKTILFNRFYVLSDKKKYLLYGTGWDDLVADGGGFPYSQTGYDSQCDRLSHVVIVWWESVWFHIASMTYAWIWYYITINILTLSHCALHSYTGPRSYIWWMCFHVCTAKNLSCDDPINGAFSNHRIKPVIYRTSW